MPKLGTVAVLGSGELEATVMNSYVAGSASCVA